MEKTNPHIRISIFLRAAVTEEELKTLPQLQSLCVGKENDPIPQPFLLSLRVWLISGIIHELPSDATVRGRRPVCGTTTQKQRNGQTKKSIPHSPTAPVDERISSHCVCVCDWCCSFKTGPQQLKLIPVVCCTSSQPTFNKGLSFFFFMISLKNKPDCTAKWKFHSVAIQQKSKLMKGSFSH